MSALLRWIHKSWKIFWGTLLTILLLVVVVIGGFVGLLQLNASKDYISKRIEKEFSRSYHGKLQIGQLDGVLPFEVVMNQVRVTPDSSLAADSLSPVLKVDQLSVDLDLWDLLRKHVTITGFSIDHPNVRLIRSDSGYTIQHVFKPRRPTTNRQQTWLQEVEIVAPLLAITEGSVYVDHLPDRPSFKRLPEPFHMKDINVSMFLELSEKQRFLDIERFFVNLPDLQGTHISLTGQVFNDDRFLEFNAFTAEVNESFVGLSGEVEGVDLYQKGWPQQFRSARYDVEIDSSRFYSKDLRMFATRVPEGPRPWTLSLSVEGNLDSLNVKRLQPGLGDSWIRFSGALENLLNPSDLAYQLYLDKNQFLEDDLADVNRRWLHIPFEQWESLRLRGKVDGLRDTMATDIKVESRAGSLQLKGGTRLESPYRYDMNFSTDSLRLARFVPNLPSNTEFTMAGDIRGVGLRPDKAVWRGQVDMTNSRLGGLNYDRAHLEVSSLEGLMKPRWTLVRGDERITGSGQLDLRMDKPMLKISGEVESLDLARYFNRSGKQVNPSRLNLDYETEIHGLKPGNIYGHASVDINQSVINGDTVKAHQFYVDLDEPGLDERQLRLTSSMLDMEINGMIDPGRIEYLARHWSDYLNKQVRRDILLDKKALAVQADTADSTDNIPVNLTTHITLKDIDLLRHYLPNMPKMASGMRINANVNADDNRLLLNADVQDSQTRVDDLTVDQGAVQLTGNFRYGRPFKNYGSLEANLTARRVLYKNRNMQGVDLNASLKRDSLYFTQQIDQISGEASLDTRLKAALGDSVVTAHLQKFQLGNAQYTWRNSTTPAFVYHSDGNLEVQDLMLENREEQFQLEGTFSNNPQKSVNYRLKDIQLGRISDLLGGRINFDGILNASFSTRSLTSKPAIQGNINVKQLAIDDRPLGDLSFKSNYNPQNEHFETTISVITDTTRYKNYVENNDGIGQDILIDGYFVPPDFDQPQKQVYAFDVNFKEIDMWILPYILPNIFQEMEGRATGQGHIAGSLQDYDFHSDFQVHDVYARPDFLNTDYWLDGHVILDRHDGVVIDSVDVVDHKGGTGILYGTVDLNNFDVVKTLDLSLRLNRLQFLNNDFNQDVPFYGTVAGTGLVRLTGKNVSPFLQTEEPVRVTQDSKLAIPLLDETELNKDNKFIRFVKNFDEPDKTKESSKSGTTGSDSGDEDVVSPSDQTFTELFDLDLQFEAPRATTVELIFDPVTGDILTANGTGQMNITLDDQDLRMFGYYNIQGGSYQFVSGDIFTRRFELESGGRITWEGDPDNARLDVTAYYRARPNINTLISGQNNSTTDTGGQRIPIELVLRITGTVSSVENNFYFRLPNTMEVSQNAAITNRINRLNADEEQKLLQATSLLLTGNFIPVNSQTNESNTMLRENLSGSAVVLNPLLSNQVLSPLLSNQINALLNSDVSSLDIDFNLTAYNEIDLGIALRLYNDRLILRREGQITGPQGSLGDLGATFRINQIFSVMAFHRQDLTLSTIEGPQGQSTEYLNGLGVEAQVQFNRWKDLHRRLMRTLSNIFSKNDDAVREEKPTVSENDGDEDGSS